MDGDVLSPIDLQTMEDARAWEASAMIKRPWRTDFFLEFKNAIASANFPIKRVLELGSGPGYLADYLIAALPSLEYVALDFSSAMHQLAMERLGAKADQVQFVQRSFREEDWMHGLGNFDCVVTLQAVHELRHKRHTATLHAGVKSILNTPGLYLVCDHTLE
jgi:cyclopropane fatty-acyl-phospholipid synthase-like methyltransferase